MITLLPAQILQPHLKVLILYMKHNIKLILYTKHNLRKGKPDGCWEGVGGGVKFEGAYLECLTELKSCGATQSWRVIFKET